MVNSLFTDDEIRQRFSDLFQIAESFCEAYTADSGRQVEIDSSLLYLVVVATYDDIARYKTYHLSDPTTQRSNGIKRSAYSTKWIMRFNPLIFPSSGHLSGSSSQISQDGLVNAMFAIHFATTNIQQFSGTALNLSIKSANSLMYDLMYRHFGEDALIFVYEMIADLASGVNPIE